MKRSWLIGVLLALVIACQVYTALGVETGEVVRQY
jgi:hypothetical protein